MKSIMFVCLGNICRSPIAEGCAKKIVKENSLDIKIDSSGTSNWHTGEAPCDNSIKVCQMNGVNISGQRASQFKKSDIEKYDLIVALDDKNVTSLKELGALNVVKLGAYGYESEDVPDPYFFDGFEGFDKVYKMINECVTNLLKEEI
ncbi:low molecular weight phosphotyrosine protein phosphatase [Sulfurimonas aquatica]|uniref:protein-tyrosine-phosphatase n=1 Tax=Sulfurimonas aquatica TaxID=2672570 RepID=A0A975AZQ6_9BACT|nr:low molecular weight protein-tyrosine-phosphatase [Sulfurimonas aquatica]QSZ41569.1 low molecular weight phosphotyrosine protein phosphatase [Sulfurimonas aquatica]